MCIQDVPKLHITCLIFLSVLRFMCNMELNKRKTSSRKKISKMSKSTEEMMVQDVETVIAEKQLSKIQYSD